MSPSCLDQNSQGLDEIGKEKARDEESAGVLINEYRHPNSGNYQPQLHREEHTLL
jgi:hypothetical protein